MIRIMLAMFTLFVGVTGMQVIGMQVTGMRVAAQEVQTSAKPKTDKVYVAFRMEDWTAKHIHDDAQAKTYADTLKQLGAEVKTSTHNGHTDVQCRTVLWKSLALDTRQQANQWATWLQKSGFETIYGNKTGAEVRTKTKGIQREIVQYRLQEWQSKHIHDSVELSQLLALYRGLGCEITTNTHDGHTDVRSRCPEWMEFELQSHDAAHQWQQFLKDAGFETKHEH